MSERNTGGRNPMPVRDPISRRSDFEEVALGYDEETAIAEAKRCLGCKNRPCAKGCPVGVPIPEFLALVAEGKFGEAYEKIVSASSLPAVSGRVCPQETQCEGKCTLGIRGEAVAIGRLERFVADRAARPKPKPVGKKGRVAIVGSGPAGLACAGELTARGYEAVIFEALHVAGGVLVYGIPNFRLPKEVVRREIDALTSRGVKIVTNAVVGQSMTVGELLDKFDAVFLGTGAGLPRFMGIEGENASGVFSANEYLTRTNLMRAYEKDSETPVYRAEKVIVVGGGNVAMDAARCAVRLGAASVTVLYRRSEEELPARKEEVEHAKEEGVRFRFLTLPVRILEEEGKVTGIRCVGMTLGEEDESGRRRPVVKEGSEFTLPADAVIMALGTSPNPLVERTTEGLEVKPLPRVYAGGDAVTGSATVILAMGAGKRAAIAIDEDLSKES